VEWSDHQFSGSSKIAIPVGAERVFLSCVGNRRMSIELEPDVDTHCTFNMGFLVLCRGKVLDKANGQAIGGAMIMGADAPGSKLRKIWITNASGEFSGWIPLNSMLTAGASGWLPAEGIIVTPRHRNEDIQFLCVPAKSFARLQIQSVNGEGLEGVEVMVGNRSPRIRYDKVKQVSVWEPTGSVVVTDKSGACRIEGAWSSTKSIQVFCQKAGYAHRRVEIKAHAAQQSKMNTIHNGSVDYAGHVVQITLGRGVKLRGRVCGEDGEGVGGVRVWMDYATHAMLVTRTDEFGYFVFERCDPSWRRQLMVDSKGWERVDRAIDASGEDNLKILLKKKR